jgi:hypothetical protein
MSFFISCGQENENNKTLNGGPENVNKSAKVIEETPIITDTSKGLKYEVASDLYTLKDDNNDIEIEYPVLKASDDKNLEKKINNLIIEEALKVIDNYDYEDRGHLDLEISYQIALETPFLMSIQHEGLAYVEKSAHPNKLFYTSNVDLLSGQIQRLEDFVKIEDDFINLFLTGGFDYVGPLDSKPDYDDFSSLESLRNQFENADTMASVYTYLTKNRLGISIEAPYAVGGYRLFEIEYQAISDFIIHDKINEMAALSSIKDKGYNDKSPYFYEPKKSMIEGELITAMHYGPPGYGENPETDKKVYPYILILDEPIEVIGDKAIDPMQVDYSDVSEIQLAVGYDDYEKIDQLVGKIIKVEGSLFYAHTGHHHRDVLMHVDKLIEDF